MGSNKIEYKQLNADSLIKLDSIKDIPLEGDIYIYSDKKIFIKKVFKDTRSKINLLGIEIKHSNILDLMNNLKWELIDVVKGDLGLEYIFNFECNIECYGYNMHYSVSQDKWSLFQKWDFGGRYILECNLKENYLENFITYITNSLKPNY